MKKVLPIVLVIALLISCLSITAFAEETQKSKITPYLQPYIEQRNPDDIIPVYISFCGNTKQKEDMPSWPDKEKASKEYKDYIDERNRIVFPQVFDGLDVQIIRDAFYNGIIANVKVSDIDTIAKSDLVQTIAFCESNYLFPKTPQGNKITPGLQEVLDTMQDDEKLEVWIDFNIRFDKFLAEQITTERTGLSFEVIGTDYTDVQLKYRKQVYIQVMYELYHGNVVDVLENLGIDESEIETEGWTFDNIRSKPQIPRKFEFTKEKVLELVRAEDNHLLSIDLYVAQDVPAPLPDDAYIYDPDGDADDDGEVTIIDATCVQKFKAELIKEDEICMTKADIDKDGVVTIIDATCIQKTLASVE